MADLQSWGLVCPLDRTPLTRADGIWRCSRCDFHSGLATVAGQTIPDLRALDCPQTVSMTFQIPITPLNRDTVARSYFRAIHQDFAYYSRAQIRQQFGTKLDKGIQYYCQGLLREYGPDAPVLDLGCGSGGNRRYLSALGFRHILTIDWNAIGADLLADAHRLPLPAEGFQMVISTAVFEHLYNPYLAMAEIGRILKPGGCFVGGASFWEAWHGSSYFHLTPDGWNALLRHGGLTLEDLWPGWGILPAALTHVLTPGYLRGVGYALQGAINGVYRLLMGEVGLRKLHLRASGAYQVFARKTINSSP
jgi:SAM-dependent methyltransferase